MRVTVQDLGKSPLMWLAFGFGTGLSPKAPGTVGTIPGVILGMVLALTLPGLVGVWPAALIILLLALGLYFIGVVICGEASRRLGVHDHGGIVFDEIVGVLLVCALLPQTWLAALLVFFWFRVFDVIKPWPINWLDQKVGGGQGIMLDDMLAGVYAAIALLLTVWLVPGLDGALLLV